MDATKSKEGLWGATGLGQASHELLQQLVSETCERPRNFDETCRTQISAVCMEPHTRGKHCKRHSLKPSPWSASLTRSPQRPRNCNLCGQLQKCQMPDIENSRKTAEKGAEWVTVKQPKNSRKNTRNTRKTAVLTVFRVFRVFFRLFFGCFTVTHSAPFSAVFRLFSMSGIWHLCSWPQRFQPRKFPESFWDPPLGDQREFLCVELWAS